MGPTGVIDIDIDDLSTFNFHVKIIQPYIDSGRSILHYIVFFYIWGASAVQLM